MKTKLFILWIFAIGLLGCNEQKDFGVDAGIVKPVKSPEHGVTTPGGVVDGSGGGALKSDQRLVARALQELPLHLSIVLYRLPELQKQLSLLTNHLDKEGIAFKWGMFSREHLTALNDVLEAMNGRSNIHSKTAYELTQTSYLKFTFRDDGPCYQENGAPADATASIRGELCFSVPRLRRIPPSSLVSEILALALHEVAHVFGFNEESAEVLQKLFSEPGVQGIILIPFNEKKLLLSRISNIRTGYRDLEREWVTLKEFGVEASPVFARAQFGVNSHTLAERIRQLNDSFFSRLNILKEFQAGIHLANWLEWGISKNITPMEYDPNSMEIIGDGVPRVYEIEQHLLLGRNQLDAYSLAVFSWLAGRRLTFENLKTMDQELMQSDIVEEFFGGVDETSLGILDTKNDRWLGSWIKIVNLGFGD